MKLFQSVQQHFKALGYHASALQANQRCQCNWKNLYFMLVLVLMVISTLGFLTFEAQSVYEYGITSYAAVTMIGAEIYYVIIIFEMGKILKLTKKYEEHIEKRIAYEPSSKAMYTELNVKIERTSKIISFVLVKLALIGTILPLSLLSVVNYCIFDLDDESFVLPWPMLLPFDRKTPFGYLIAFLGECVTVHSAVFGFAPASSFFVGSAWLAICFIRDIANELVHLNVIATSTQSRMELMKQFGYIVRFYSDVKQLVNELSQIYRFIICTLLLWALLSISSVLLVFLSQLSMQHSNQIEMIFTLILMCTSFFVILFLCEFGEMVNAQFDRFDGELCQCEWYKFPHGLQRMLVTFMTYTQQPAMIHGFANTECTRMTFKKTINGGFSYFMTLRKLDG